MLDLSALKFQVDTSELERADKIIGTVVSNMTKLDKAAREAAQTEAILARAAKDNAKANLDNAKAQDTRLKSTIAADKADQQAAAAIEKRSKATKDATDAVSKSVSILERHKDILEYQTQGYSKGQASILAYGKAAGMAAEELAELGKVLETQRKLMGGDPFDKSLSGIKSLRNQYTELKEAVRQYGTDSALTAKQTRELARDKERLIEKMKVEGASFSDIRKAVRSHNQEFVNLASQYNKLASAEENIIKQRKELVAATNYVTQADAKMAAALNTSNAAIDKAGTDSLVKYENALRKSGVSQEIATVKLAKYKLQLEQVRKLEMARSEQFLTRALAPQATDVAVSLWSGQNPLTVLLQQGGQINDLFMQSGIAAEKFGEVVKKSMQSMLPSILAVAKGIGGLIVDGFVAAGAAITGFLGKITLFTAASDQVYKYLASDGPSVAAQRWAKLSDVLSKSVAVGFAAVLTVLIAMAVEYKKIIQVESELSKALATSGGAMGFSKDQAVAYAESMQAVGVGTLKAMDAIAEFAKAGKVGKDGLDLIIKSAIDLEKYAGVAISETAKQYAKLQDEPTKALTEIAAKTGLVDVATLDYVATLEQQGDKAKAAEEATKALTDANRAMADEIKSNLSPIEALWDDIRSAIGKVKQEIYDMTTSNANISAMRVVWQSLAVTVSEFWFVLKGVGRELGGIAAQIGTMNISALDMLNPAALATKIATGFNNDQAKNIRQQMIEDAKNARAEQDKLVASIMAQGTQEKKNFADSKENNSKYAEWRKENEKALERQFTKEERLGLKKKQLQNDLNAGIIDEIKYKQALAGWERIIMGEKKPKTDKQAIKDLEVEIDLRNKSLGLLSSFNNELDAIERRRAKTGDEDEYQASLNALIAKQPIYLERQKEINAAHDLANKLMGKADMLGKDYYKTLEQIQANQDSGLYSPERAEELRQAAYSQTQLAKEQLKYVEQSTETYTKYSEEAKKSLDSTTLENAKLDDRLELLGLTSDEQKQLKIQQQQRNSLLAVDLKLTAQIAKLWNDVREGKIDPFDAMAAQVELERAAAEERKAINKEVAVQYGEDFMQEMQKIKSGISDAIVTALFEGGKAGSKKLRDVLVSVLRQKVTMVVDVGVNAFLNSMLGGLFGGGGAAGGAGGIAGGILGNVATSAGTSMLGSALGIGNGASFLGGFGGSIIPASMVGPSAAAPTLMSSLGNFASSIPGWGWAIAGIAALAGLMSKKATPHAGAGSTYSAAGGLQSINLGAANNMGFMANYSKETQGMTDQIAKTLVTALDSTATTFGTKAGYAVSTAFADDSSKDGAWGQLIIGKDGKDIVNWGLEQGAGKWAPKEFGDGEAGQREYMLAIAKDARNALKQAIGDVEWATDMLDALGESPTVEQLAATMDQINQLKTAFDTLGRNIKGFAELTNEATNALIEASGGAQALIANTQTFYDNYYSDAEKKANVERDIEKALKEVGLEMPKTREEYRKLLESQLALGESGAKGAAVLLKYSGAFASITEDSNKALQDEMDRQEELRQAYIQQRKEILNIQIESVQKQIDTFQRLFDFLDAEVKKLYGSVESTAKMQLAQAQAIILKAQTTKKLPDVEVLQDAVGTITGSMTSNKYATKFEMERDKLRFAAQLDDLRGIADKNLKSAKNAFDVLKLQLEQLDELNVVGTKQLNALYDIKQSIEDIDLTGNGEPAPNKPGRVNSGGGGGGGTRVSPGYSPDYARTSYGAMEALQSQEKFSAWFNGLRSNAVINPDYKVPDWLNAAGGALMGQGDLTEAYLFFKNNPSAALDYEKIMQGGLSDMPTGGDTLVRSNLDSMPAWARDYYSKNIAELRVAETFGFDPVLALDLYQNGSEKFGLDKSKISFTEWLRSHKYEDGKLVARDPREDMPQGYTAYPNARWDSTTGTLVDTDGTIYSKEGKRLGDATGSLMHTIFGENLPQNYYNKLRAKYDSYISSGYNGQQLVDAVNSSGDFSRDIARAYGISVDTMIENLMKAGATSLPAFKDGGNYAGGLALVGEEGPELINFNRPGYVYTAGQTAAMASQGAVVECLNTLNERVAMLEANTRTSAVSNLKVERLLNRLSPDGDSLQVKTVEGSVTTVV
jgi:hypothetical protein